MRSEPGTSQDFLTNLPYYKMPGKAIKPALRNVQSTVAKGRPVMGLIPWTSNCRLFQSNDYGSRRRSLLTTGTAMPGAGCLPFGRTSRLRLQLRRGLWGRPAIRSLSGFVTSSLRRDKRQATSRACHGIVAVGDDAGFCLWGPRGVPVRPGVLGVRPKSTPKPGLVNLPRSRSVSRVGRSNPSVNVLIRTDSF